MANPHRPIDIGARCNVCNQGFALNPEDITVELQQGPLSQLLASCPHCDAPQRLGVPTLVALALAWAGVTWQEFDPVNSDEPFSPPEILGILETLGNEYLFDQELQDLLDDNN